MNTGNRIGRMRILRGLTIAGAALAALVLAAQIPAEAHGRHGNYHHPYRGAAHVHSYHRGAGVVYVPRSIYAPDFVTYRPWYAGRAYYGPHGHYHVAYRFPVLVGGALVYRPYSYCGDHLFVTAAVPLPRLMIGLNLGPHVGVYGETALPVGGYAAGGRYDGE